MTVFCPATLMFQLAEYLFWHGIGDSIGATAAIFAVNPWILAACATAIVLAAVFYGAPMTNNLGAGTGGFSNGWAEVVNGPNGALYAAYVNGVFFGIGLTVLMYGGGA
jgi:hypothetical protein